MIVQDQQHTFGETCIRVGVVRIQFNGRFKLFACFLQRLKTTLVQVVAALRVQVVRRQAVCGNARHAELLIISERCFQRARNFRRNLTLNGKQIGRTQFTVVRTRPDVFVGRRVDELRRDSYAVALPLYRALDERADAEFFTNLPQVLGRVPILHYGCPGNDLE